MWPPVEYGDTTSSMNPRTVAEEVQRLDVARVVVAACLIRRDEHRGGPPEVRLLPQLGQDLADERLEDAVLRRGRMTVVQSARLHERHGRQNAILDVGVEIRGVLITEVRSASLVMIEVWYWNGLQMLQ